MAERSSQDYQLLGQALAGLTPAAAVQGILATRDGQHKASTSQQLRDAARLVLLAALPPLLGCGGGAPDRLQLFVVCSAAAAAYPWVEEVAQALQASLQHHCPGLSLGWDDDHTDPGGDSSVNMDAGVGRTAGGGMAFTVQFAQGAQQYATRLKVKIAAIFRAAVVRQPIAITGLQLAEGGGRCTAELAAPLGSRQTGTRVRLELGGFGDSKLDGRSLKATVGAGNRRTVTFSTSGVGAERLAAIAAALQAGNLQPVVSAWWDREQPPQATGLQFELPLAAAAWLSVQPGGQAVPLAPQAAADVRRALAALLEPVHGRLAALLGAAAQAASLPDRLEGVEAAVEALQEQHGGQAEHADGFRSLVLDALEEIDARVAAIERRPLPAGAEAAPPPPPAAAMPRPDTGPAMTLVRHHRISRDLARTTAGVPRCTVGGELAHAGAAVARADPLLQPTSPLQLAPGSLCTLVVGLLGQAAAQAAGAAAGQGLRSSEVCRQACAACRRPPFGLTAVLPLEEQPAAERSTLHYTVTCLLRHLSRGPGAQVQRTAAADGTVRYCMTTPPAAAAAVVAGAAAEAVPA